jgi:hypothetical protein
VIDFYFKKFLKTYTKICSSFGSSDMVYTECVSTQDFNILIQSGNRPAAISYETSSGYGTESFLYETIEKKYFKL